jgi:Tfp pilus assembly protein PilF
MAAQKKRLSSRSLTKREDRPAPHKDQDVSVLIRNGLKALKRLDWQKAGQLALEALAIEERNAVAWHILALSREKLLDYDTAIQCYEKALILNPESLIIANDLGRLAFRMNMHEMAIKFYSVVLAREPGNIDAANNLASSLRELNRLDEAIDFLKPIITHYPQHSALWNTMATIVNAKGDLTDALLFYDEAIRLNPKLFQAIYNRANIKFGLGDFASAIADMTMVVTKFTDIHNLSNASIALAHMLLGSGELKAGWQQYLSRQQGVGASAKITAVIGKPRWDIGSPLIGKHIFVSAEQGLGDEVLFASLLPDLIEDLGPDGRLSLGVEPRLVTLFQRSFPKARVYSHITKKHNEDYYRFFPDLAPDHDADLWAFMGDFLSRYRSKIEDFPKDNVFFRPDPERVAYWQAQVAAQGSQPKIGLLWKSLIQHSARDRYYSPFEPWKDILATEGLTFINLQYGDVSEELEAIKQAGLKIWTPPGINLKDDLDDLCALCCAMDVILGPSNATSNIAAAAGTPIWIITPQHSWACLGEKHYPWYPKARVFFTRSLGDWRPVMAQVKSALIETYLEPKPQLQLSV